MTNGVPPTSSSTGGTAQQLTNAGQTLGKDDFLKLLVTQLQHQDPMNPMDDKDFMGQMAQFSSLEQITNMSSALQRMDYSNQLSQSVGLIGRTVTYAQQDGTLASGVASSVSTDENDAITIKIGDASISPADVREVA